ncbi:SDR family oxidoreductase [Vibrio maerlii]|uniref:SDR family oxidoreductase n=1 Tax=Vibrio maerlii TaxID=2231648 RepID=UPI000E3D8F06|nr:SDR family oxidoreductase [Vibrio maerlii]
MNILILGGNGGIGRAIVDECLNRYPEATIHATFRLAQPEEVHNVVWYQVDVTQELEMEALSQRIPKVDWIVNCIGLLHNEQHGPEKNVSAISSDFFQQNIMTNTLPTLLLAKHFTPKLKLSASPKLATISAKVGSISDNRLGGWYSYRASKAALNMALKTLSIEWQRSVKNGVVLALHPGTTDTHLSKPFQARVPEGKLFTSQRVANDLLDIIENSSPENSGKFFAYNGEELSW